jgi:hypothetical protein
MTQSIQVSITAAHIADAKPYPNSSPIALALRDSGYLDACATKQYAYCGDKVYQLPEIAIASESCFDYLANGGSSQGEIIEEIKPYECELEELTNV